MSVSSQHGGLPSAAAHHLPKSAAALHDFHRDLKQTVASTKVARSPAVQALAKLIEERAIVRMYTEQMLEQVVDLPGAPPSRIETVAELLDALSAITKIAPLFNADPAKRHAFPMSSLFVYMMMTRAGEAVFRDPAFNHAIQLILKEWCAYLDSKASTNVLNTTPTGWLSPAAFKEFDLQDFEIDLQKPAGGFAFYNAFFHRQIKPQCRPIADPEDRRIIVSANDGNVVSIAREVKRYDRFWLKGEPFSLADMLDHSAHVDRFVGGDVFQSFLSGGNYHRWHTPIAGQVREARVVDGLMFSDAELAGWDPSGVLSEGYYACVNSRGLVFIESDDPTIGMVCVVPIGITEISSIRLVVKAGDKVTKGQELGFFSYGGSSMCVVFQPRAIARFTVPEPPPKPIVDPASGPPIKVNAEIARAR